MNQDSLHLPVNRIFLAFSVVLILFAASLRIYHISQRSLWLDEAIAANISRGTLPETLILTRAFHSAPIVDPLLLYGVEKASTGALAVRIPSLVASLAAVLLMLCFVTIPSIDYRTAGLSALMLSVSAVQVRYAQEVREYSLSVLYAEVLMYVFLSYTSNREENGSPTLLYLTLFVAPFVQYGLVLFSLGVLAALLIVSLTDSKRRVRITHIVTGSVFLAAGGLLSFFLTLRYQWGEDAWYLQDYYYVPGSSFLHFVVSNTHYLFTSFLPGLAAAAISVVAILVHVVTSIRARCVSPLSVLVFTSVGVVLACGILHIYPFGGIRQCLFLAPVLCLFAAASLVQISSRFTKGVNSVVFATIVCVVVVSGAVQFRSVKPYAEVEDIQNVLLGLRNQIQSGDGVYIYPGAVPAVDFYVKERDARFIYGDFHQQAPEKYVSEMLAGLPPKADRLWIVFSHVYRDEDQRIIHDLSADWKVDSVVSVKGSALYLASRRPGVPDVTPALNGDVSDAPRIADTFWDWNIRNGRKPSQYDALAAILRKL